MKLKFRLGAIVALCFVAGISVHATEQKTAGKGNVDGFIQIFSEDTVYLENEINTLLADGIGRRDSIKSKGKIDFDNGTVVLDSADLLYLAEQVDDLESTYKVNIVDALNRIGTYFRNDGSIVVDASVNEVDTEEEKKNLSFGNMKEGILQSQSVVSISGVQAADKDGNTLFYLNQEAAGNHNLLQTTIQNTEFPVFYQPVTAENLTAGTAAWVNGKLIMGNGGDNASCYAQGFVDGQANATENLDVTYTYHYHEGDDVNGGGCYAQVTNHTVCGVIGFSRGYYRGKSCDKWCSSYYADEYACSACGAVTGWKCGGGGNSCGKTGGQIGGNHMVTTTSWQPVCGYSQGQILTATIVY